MDPSLPQPNKPVKGNEQPRRKRISGAEQKKRRRARQAALEATGQAPTPSTSTGLKQAAKPKPQGSGKQPAENQYKKRHRSDGSTPSRNPIPKRRKEGTGSKGTGAKSYSSMTVNHLRVAVIDKQLWESDPLGRITSEQAGRLEEELTRILDCDIQSGTTQPAPNFGAWNHTQGMLRITCADEGSLRWLKTAVSKVPQLWEGARLEVIAEDKLPKLTKATLFIPGKPDELEVVMSRLVAQNTSLKVNSWVTFHEAITEPPNQGRLLVFGIGEGDLAILSGSQGRLYYKFSSLKLKLRGNPQTEERAVTTPMEVVEQPNLTVGSTKEKEEVTVGRSKPTPVVGGAAQEPPEDVRTEDVSDQRSGKPAGNHGPH